MVWFFKTLWRTFLSIDQPSQRNPLLHLYRGDNLNTTEMTLSIPHQQGWTLHHCWLTWYSVNVKVSKSQNVMRTKPLKVSKINQLTVKASFLCFCWYTKNLFQFSCNLSQDGKGFLYSWFAFLKQMCWMQPCTSYILSLLMIYQFMCIAYCCQNYTRLVWIILSIIHLVCRLIQSEATSTRKKLKNFWEAAECEHHWTAIQQDFVLT